MNDEFLHRLRTEPSVDFVARLKARLASLDATPAPRSHILKRHAVIALAIGGATLALASPVVRNFIFAPFHSLRAATETAPVSTSPAMSLPAAPIVPARVPVSDETRTSVTGTRMRSPGSGSIASRSPTVGVFVALKRDPAREAEGLEKMRKMARATQPVEPSDPNREVIMAAVSRYYPAILTTRIPGRVFIWVLTDRDGHIERIEMEARTGPSRTVTALEELEERYGVSGQELLSGAMVGFKNSVNSGLVIWGVRTTAAAAASTSDVYALPKPMDLYTEPPPGVVDARTIHSALELMHPTSLTQGVEDGEGIWFLSDSRHNVLFTGREARFHSSVQATDAMTATFPGIRIESLLMSGGSRDALGGHVPVVWATLGPDSPEPQFSGR